MGRWAVGTSAAFLDMELLAASFDTTDDEFGWIVGKKLERLGDWLKLDDLVVDAAGESVSRYGRATSGGTTRGKTKSRLTWQGWKSSIRHRNGCRGSLRRLGTGCRRSRCTVRGMVSIRVWRELVGRLWSYCLVVVLLSTALFDCALIDDWR